ncbi:MAG: sugar ABC transporter substrate-binding protein [Candidatus Methanomethylicaceae archaeon]
MNETDRRQRLAVADYADKLRKGKISRREFLKLSAMAGFGFTSLYFLSGCAPKQAATPTKEQILATVGPTSAIEPQTPQQKFLKEVGGMFKGTTIRIVSESTPPSRAINEIAKTEFIPLTGINVEWEQLPLDQVLAKLSQDTAGGLGVNDIYYWDQAWIGRFINDAVDPQEMLAKTDLLYPDYNFDDFLPPLVENIAMYKGKLGALPYDIPIFITMYRKDVFEELGLKPPTTFQEYMECAKAINEAKAPNMYGTVAQWKSGHYSLECSMTMFLWGHGGSIYNSEGKATINDERAVAAMEYMLELGKYMPPGVVTWDWSGEADAFAQGLAGFYTSWGEFFPSFDDPQKSKIVGLAEPLRVPAAIALRKKEECGFDETPGVSHQGGSSLALSKYSKNKEAAWIFMQWATSADIMVRASLLGGGATPMRFSSFTDPRILENNKVMPGTTRHFEVTKEAILNYMGTEPHLPAWASLSVDSFAVELGKMTTGQQDIKTTLDKMAKAANEAAASAS